MFTTGIYVKTVTKPILYYINRRICFDNLHFVFFSWCEQIDYVII